MEIIKIFYEYKTMNEFIGFHFLPTQNTPEIHKNRFEANVVN